MGHTQLGPLQLVMGLGLIGLVTCGGLDQIATTQTATARVPAGGLVDMLAGDLGFESLATFDIASSQELQNQGVKRSQIDSVRVTRLALEVLTPAEQKLDFLDSVSFFVVAENLARRRIAHIDAVPRGVREVDLTLDDVDLADYAAAPSMAIETEVSGRRPSQETDLQVTLELLVNVDIGGVICGD